MNRPYDLNTRKGALASHVDAGGDTFAVQRAIPDHQYLLICTERGITSAVRINAEQLLDLCDSIAYSLGATRK